MSEASHVRASIILPAYNEEKYIGDCLRSLKAQVTDFSFEIIVVDNNSTDETAAIARLSGVRVVKETQAGVCYARQKGLEEARGEIIVSTDADTTFAPTWLQKLVDAFDDPKVVGATGAIRFITNPPLWSIIWARILAAFMYVTGKLFGSVAYMSACNSAYRKAKFTGYSTHLTQGGDEIYVVNQLKKAGKVVYVKNNPVFTSSRRNVRGFLYNAFVMIFVYYILEYWLSKLFKRQVFGRYPAFRDENEPLLLRYAHMIVVVTILLGVLLLTPFGHHLYRSTNRFVRKHNPVMKVRNDVRDVF